MASWDDGKQKQMRKAAMKNGMLRKPTEVVRPGRFHWPWLGWPAHGLDTLRSRYSKIATKWHKIVLHLGYLEAYGSFAAAVYPCARSTDQSAAVSVLDIGSGTGGFALALARHLKPRLEIDLLDVSAAMLLEAQSNLGAEGYSATSIQGDLSAVSGHGGKYDVISAAHVVEHFDDLDTGLHDMAQLLKSGGQLLLVVSKPHWCNRLVWLRWRHKVYAEAQIMAALQQAGFFGATVYRFPSGAPSRTSLGFAACRNIEQ
jgi:2-polyprenyl-3-methyl-5-hydroxy-6-metoxy-1,4-benzoquinol methylase